MGLYLEPPENALVLCVDEKPARRWTVDQDGQGDYSATTIKRNGTTTLFAALDVATGLVRAGPSSAARDGNS